MSELGLQSWAAKLTTTFGEPGYPEWLNSVRADIAIWCNAGKVRLAGPKDYFEPLPIGGEFGGTRYFATRADAEEWGQNHVAWTFTHALGRKPDVMDSDDGAEGRDVALWNAAWAAAMPSLTASA